MKKKNVCILSNGLAYGGTDTFVVNLVKGLDKDRFEVTIANYSINQATNVREQEVLDEGIKVIHTAELSTFKGKCRHLYLLYKLLKKNGIWCLSVKY